MVLCLFGKAEKKCYRLESIPRQASLVSLAAITEIMSWNCFKQN